MAVRRFYVYRIYDGHETVYVGKGSGRRLKQQARKFRLPAEIVEECKSEDHAFKREIHWTETLRPTLNSHRGGAGGRCRVRRKPQREFAEIERIGSRRYAARFLLRKIDERNCAALGLSKVDVNRLREVANGPRC